MTAQNLDVKTALPIGGAIRGTCYCSMNANESCFINPVCNLYCQGKVRDIKTALII